LVKLNFENDSTYTFANLYIIHCNHFKKELNHLKPSAYPCFLATLHINTSIGRELLLFHSFFCSIPNASRNSFSGTAPALSILLPKITIGTFSSYGISKTPCNYNLLSSKRFTFEESIR